MKIVKNMLCLCLIIAVCTSCHGRHSDVSERNRSRYDQFITVDVYDYLANYQGMQSGWFAKEIKDRFNMELNIIAPNVYGSGDALFETRSAAGNLGDLIITGTEGGRMDQMISSGLMYDISDLIKDREHLRKYYDVIESMNKKVTEKGIYGIPSEISEQSPQTSNDGIEPLVAPYVRWDAYSAVGYPKMETLEDYLDVMQKMKKQIPRSDSGKETYPISLFKDWDDNMLVAAKNFASLYGYIEQGFTLSKADGSDIQDITDPAGIYVRVLHFLFEANQRGLVDPESTTQNYNMLSRKYMDGQILTSLWSYQSQSVYNTEENQSAGIGFMPAFIEDSTPLSYGCYSQGNAKTIIGVGKNTSDPERLVDFIDWLYSPEGMEIAAASNHGIGPEGLTWEKQGDKAVFTEFGIKALAGENPELPDTWGGGHWSDGISGLNFKPLAMVDTDPNTGEPYLADLWTDALESRNSKLIQDWRDKYHAKTSIEFLVNKNALAVATGSSYIAPKESQDIATIRRQCKPIITDYSWKMIFASTEKEFYSLLQKMQDTAYGMGYQKVIASDTKNVKEEMQLRQQEIQQYQRSQD